jgi:hypothetical protein
MKKVRYEKKVCKKVCRKGMQKDEVCKKMRYAKDEVCKNIYSKNFESQK